MTKPRTNEVLHISLTYADLYYLFRESKKDANVVR
jgi:hypothetical protein